MFTGNPVHTHESGATTGIRWSLTASSLCFLQRNLATGTGPMDGVSTYLALIFGTLLSSQGTDASFVLTLSGFPPGFPSVLRFRLYQTVSGPDFLGAFQVSASAFPFPAVPTLSEVLSRNFQPSGSGSRHTKCPGSPSGGAVNVL